MARRHSPYREPDRCSLEEQREAEAAIDRAIAESRRQRERRRGRRGERGLRWELPAVCLAVLVMLLGTGMAGVLLVASTVASVGAAVVVVGLFANSGRRPPWTRA